MSSVYEAPILCFLYHNLIKGYTNPGRQVAQMAKYITVAPNTCGANKYGNLFSSRICSLEILSGS
jgi:hypothetical protein